MDPITHGLTGAVLSQAGFTQRLGQRTVPAMIAAAMFPDIDIVYRFQGLPEYIENHRALSHSFIGVLGAGILIGAILGRIDEKRRYFAWICAMWVGLFSHQLLDLITSYGTVILYPFSNRRFYFDWIFIIDLFLTGILLFSLLISRSPKRNKQKIAKTGLLLASAYIFFCALNHQLAVYQLRESARENQIPYKSIAAIPQPLVPLLWSGIIDAENHYYQTVFYSTSRPSPPFQIFTKSTGSFWENQVRSSEMGQLYFWFARYPVVEESVHGNVHILEVYDLRFFIRLHKFPVRKPFVIRFRLDESGNIVESRFVRS